MQESRRRPTVSFFPYRTKARRAEVTRESPVGADEHKFKCRTTVVQVVQPIVHIVCVVHAHRFKSPSRLAGILAFYRSGKDHSDLVSERAPLSLHHPPGGTWVHHHPSPLRGERAARACASRSASRIYIADPPPVRGSCTIPARTRSAALPAIVSLRTQFSSSGCRGT